MRNALKLVISISIPLLIGATAGFFTDTGSWYQNLGKPIWNPPSWVFGPVWTALYILMGIALYLVWNQPVDRQLKRVAVILFAIQLGLNFFWSFIFFELHEVKLAFFEIVLLWFAILFTIIWFSKINKLAAWLLVTYISWVSFAGILNYTIWMLNKSN